MLSKKDVWNSYVMKRGNELRKLCRDIRKTKDELEECISMFKHFEQDESVRNKISDCILNLGKLENLESPKEIISDAKNKKNCASLYQFFYKDTDYVNFRIKESSELVNGVIFSITGLNLEYE